MGVLAGESQFRKKEGPCTPLGRGMAICDGSQGGIAAENGLPPAAGPFILPSSLLACELDEAVSAPKTLAA